MAAPHSQRIKIIQEEEHIQQRGKHWRQVGPAIPQPSLAHLVGLSGVVTLLLTLRPGQEKPQMVWTPDGSTHIWESLSILFPLPNASTVNIFLT